MSVRSTGVSVVWIKFLLFFVFIGLSIWLNINPVHNQRLFPDHLAISDPSQTTVLHTININQANSEMLVALPGIGPKLASNIIQYRQQHGDYHKLSDLVRVRGIGPKKADQIKSYIHFSNPQPPLH